MADFKPFQVFWVLQKERRQGEKEKGRRETRRQFIWRFFFLFLKRIFGFWLRLGWGQPLTCIIFSSSSVLMLATVGTQWALLTGVTVYCQQHFLQWTQSRLQALGSVCFVHPIVHKTQVTTRAPGSRTGGRKLAVSGTLSSTIDGKVLYFPFLGLGLWFLIWPPNPSQGTWASGPQSRALTGVTGAQRLEPFP